MKHRMRFLLTCAVSLWFFAASSAQATILSNFLTFDGLQHTPAGPPSQGGGEDKLQDDSLSAFADLDNSGGFSDGDVVYGIVTMSEINASGRPSAPVGADSQIAVVFSAKISGTGAGGSINLVPIGDATDALDLRMLLDGSVTSSLDDKSIAVIMSTSTPDTNAADDPLNWSNVPADADYFAKLFTAANNWSWEATFGDVAATDFVEFTGTLALGGSERGAFTVQDQAFGVDDWVDVDVLDFGATKRLADATLDVGTVNIASVEEQARAWTFRDQGSYFLNPVPEPASVALMGIALAGLGFAGRRKQKRSA